MAWRETAIDSIEGQSKALKQSRVDRLQWSHLFLVQSFFEHFDICCVVFPSLKKPCCEGWMRFGLDSIIFKIRVLTVVF